MASNVTIDVTTSSAASPTPPATPAYPTIAINGAALPSPPAPAVPSPSGWQVVAIDAAADIAAPSSILLNQYYFVRPDSAGSWAGDSVEHCYDEVLRGLLGAGDIFQQIFILVSFGLDQYMMPTVDLYQYLLSQGAGPQLQKWVNGLNWDSGDSGWVSLPANYVVVGGSLYPYGAGYEQFDTNTPSVQTKFEAVLTPDS